VREALEPLDRDEAVDIVEERSQVSGDTKIRVPSTILWQDLKDHREHLNQRSFGRRPPIDRDHPIIQARCAARNRQRHRTALAAPHKRTVHRRCQKCFDLPGR